MTKKILLLFVAVFTISIGAAAQGIATDKYAEEANYIFLMTDGYSSIHDVPGVKVADEDDVPVCLLLMSDKIMICVLSENVKDNGELVPIIQGTFNIHNSWKHKDSATIFGSGTNTINNEYIEFLLDCDNDYFYLTFNSSDKDTDKDTQSPLNRFAIVPNYISNTPQKVFFGENITLDIENMKQGNLKQLRKRLVKKYKSKKW